MKNYVAYEPKTKKLYLVVAEDDHEAQAMLRGAFELYDADLMVNEMGEGPFVADITECTQDQETADVVIKRPKPTEA